MSENPNPLNMKNLSRATIAGVLLATGGIALFAILWVVLGNAGVDQLARLITALCVPPALMATLTGGYFLLMKPQNNPEKPEPED